MVYAKTELKLIQAVKENDEGALQELFENYRPLVEKNKRKFYARDFDEADWDQEALIVCHQAVLKFNPKKGKFCTFFKKQLYNHNVSLLRYRKASRREGENLCMSLEALTEVNSSLIKEKSETMLITEELAKDYLSDLSGTELKAFKIDLGKETLDELVKNGNWDKEKLKRAHSRAYKKFVDAIFEK